MATQPRHAGITLAQLAASGRHIVVQCGECPTPFPAGLDLRMDTPVNMAARCSSVASAVLETCSPIQRATGMRVRDACVSQDAVRRRWFTP